MIFFFKKSKKFVHDTDLYFHILHEILVLYEIKDKQIEDKIPKGYFITRRPYELKQEFLDTICEFQKKFGNKEDIKTPGWGGKDYTINSKFFDLLFSRIINK